MLSALFGVLVLVQSCFSAEVLSLRKCYNIVGVVIWARSKHDNVLLQGHSTQRYDGFVSIGSALGPSSVTNRCLQNVQHVHVNGKRRKLNSNVLFSWLKSHNIGLAVELPVLTPNNCGKMPNSDSYYEGIQPEGIALTVIQRIKQNGGKYPFFPIEKLTKIGDLKYIMMDEPLLIGHLLKAPGTCNFPLTDLANNAATNLKKFRRIFPNVLIGDIEPISTSRMFFFKVVYNFTNLRFSSSC